jgi:hypothetical protein
MNTISREVFDAMDRTAQVSHIRSGGRVEDVARQPGPPSDGRARMAWLEERRVAGKTDGIDMEYARMKAAGR